MKTTLDEDKQMEYINKKALQTAKGFLIGYFS